MKKPVAGIAVAVVAAGALVWVLWPSNKTEPASTPTAATTTASEDVAEIAVLDLEPADGATIHGTDAWVRWRSPSPANGKLHWRKQGDAQFHEVPAVEGNFLLARIPDLEPGRSYEFKAENSRRGLRAESGTRTFKAVRGVEFEAARLERVVQRDYAQVVPLRLDNHGNDKVRVSAKALARFDELPADVVGRGSVDEPADLEGGASMSLDLVVTAGDALRETYEIPVEAGGAFAVVRVSIAKPKFTISMKVTHEDSGTLAKTVTITNEGDALPDLRVAIVPPFDAEARLAPTARHAYLGRGGTREFVVAPLLYLEFQALELELEASAAGESRRLPLAFKAPDGVRLIGVRTRTTHASHSSDAYCTNHPVSCSDAPGPDGNGPEKDPMDDPKVREDFEKNVYGHKILGGASKYLGKPYRLGSKGPDVFDCSGLVSQGFRDAGLPDPMDTGTGSGCRRIWDNLDPVPAAETRPGDIIFFDYENDGNPDHCGIVNEIGGKEVGFTHASGSGVNEGNGGQNAKQVNGVWTKYKVFISGYRRVNNLPPTPGTCTADAPCHEEKK